MNEVSLVHVAKKGKSPCTNGKLWQLAQARCHEQALGQFDEIYALPRPLIEMLAHKLELVSEVELDFELALSSEAGAGLGVRARMPLNAVI